jgi:RNA polymerase sigma-B factor
MFVDDTSSKTRADDCGVLERFRTYRRTGDRGLRNELVVEFAWVGRVAARRFANKGEPLDDLVQVAMYGVVKALERFDPDYGHGFATYALPTAVGELRRYFRDATWSVRVDRRTKELHLAMTDVVGQLTQELGRSPRVPEIAAHMRVSVDDVIEALQAGRSYRAAPLEHRNQDDSVVEAHESRLLSADDPAIGSTADRVALHDVMSRMPERERRILYLRFFQELTQSEIAEQVGLSQVHVSRLLRSTLLECRRQLAALDHASD